MVADAKKIGKFRTLMIMLQSGGSLLWYSAWMVFLSLIGRLSRKDVDYYQRKWAQKTLDIVKLTYTLHNPYQVDFNSGAKYLLMCNHASHYDIPLSMVAIDGSIRMLTKKELFRVPIWGSALRCCEYVSIDRNNRTQALKDLEKAKEKLESGILLWVAPEGTRSRTGKLQPFKKGGFMLALQTQATIVPITITGTYDVLPPKTWRFLLNKHADVYIGKPIYAGDYTLETRDELMTEVKKQISGPLVALETEPGNTPS